MKLYENIFLNIAQDYIFVQIKNDDSKR